MFYTNKTLAYPHIIASLNLFAPLLRFIARLNSYDHGIKQGRNSSTLRQTTVATPKTGSLTKTWGEGALALVLFLLAVCAPGGAARRIATSNQNSCKQCPKNRGRCYEQMRAVRVEVAQVVRPRVVPPY